jgi:drug/metabolite transporter (DMT)-like permease
VIVRQEHDMRGSDIQTARIPSAEAALIGTLEIVLSPIWVWAGLAERPTNAALVGGAAIFGAVLWHTAGDWNLTSDDR